MAVARLIIVTGISALSATLFSGCGGADDRAKVEASLRHYVSNLDPEAPPRWTGATNRTFFPIGATHFPIGAGPPRIQKNGCKDRHVEAKNGQMLSSPTWTAFLPEDLALWSCVIKFGSYATAVLVGVNDSTEVVFATAGRFEQFELK
jgi:hypothetical protein